MNVFDLAAVLTLDKTQYEEGLDSAEKDASSFGTKLKGGLGTAAKVGIGAITALGTATVGAGKMFVDNAGQAAEYGDNIDKMSQKMGISAQAYQEWDAIMRHSGTTIDALKPSMKTLANAAQKGDDAFQKLGISEKEVAELSQEDLFARVISGLQGMEEGTERTAITSKLLGRGATELGALLNTSAKDTEEMRKRVHELGGVMSDDAVKGAARYQDSLQDMQTSMAGLKNHMMSDFLPAFADVMDGLGAIFSGDSSGMVAIDQGIDTIVNKLSEGVPKVLEIGGKIIESLGKAMLDNLPKLAESVGGVVLTLVHSFMDGLPQILETGVQIIGGLVNGLTEALPDLIPAAVDAILTIVEGLVDHIDEIIEAAGKIIIALGEGLIKALPKLVAKLPEIIMAILNGLGKILSSIFELGGNIIKGLWEGISSGIGKLGEVIASIGQAIWDGITYIPRKIFEFGQELIDNLTGAIDDGEGDVFKTIGNVGKVILDALWALPGKVFEIGANIVGGLVNGIGSFIGGAVDAVGNFFGGIVDGAKNLLGIHSPSKVFAQIGRFTAEGFSEGFDDQFDNVKKLVDNDLNSLSAQDIEMGNISYGVSSSNNGIVSLLNDVLTKVGNQQIILDTGVLVGQTVNKYDVALGQLANKNMRGVLI